MNITPELLSKLTPEAAERMALLQMLLASTSPAEAQRIIAERAAAPTHQVLPDGRAVVLDMTDSQRKTICSQILVALASCAIPTPEETYGTNVEWATSDLINALKENDKVWREYRKKWCVPKAGDRVKLLKLTDATPAAYMEEGGIYEVEYITTFATPQPANQATEDNWKLNTKYAVALKTSSGNWVALLENVEAVNE